MSTIFHGFMLHRYIYLIILILLLSGCDKVVAPPSSADYWESIPLNTHAKFNAVYFTDDLNGWLAGGSHSTQGGLLGTTTDGGLTWDLASRIANSKTNNLTSVRFLDSTTGIVGTDKGEILKTTDGGRSWQTKLNLRGGFRNRVSDFEFVSAELGYAVIGDRVIRTQDFGNTWQCLTAASRQCPAAPDCPDGSQNPKLDASTISFLTPTHAVAISQRYAIATSQDGGCTWEIGNSLTGPDRVRLADMFFVNAERGWVVGEQGFVATTNDGGLQWSIQNPGVAAHFTAVHFNDSTTGYLTGQRVNKSGSVIMYTQDAGQTWALEQVVTNDLLEDLFINQSHSVWAAGEVLDITHGQNLLRKPGLRRI